MRVSNERTDWLARHVFPHEPAIRGWLKHRLALGLEIDDVIHDMYAKLIALPSVAGIENPRRYAFRVAWAIVADHVRHQKVIPMAPMLEDEQLRVASPDPSIEDRLCDRGAVSDLEAVLSALPPLCREAFYLRRVEGLSQRETAEKLGLSEKTIEKYMTRAVRLIMDAFGRGGKPRVQPSYTAEPPNEVRKRERP